MFVLTCFPCLVTCLRYGENNSLLKGSVESSLCRMKGPLSHKTLKKLQISNAKTSLKDKNDFIS